MATAILITWVALLAIQHCATAAEPKLLEVPLGRAQLNHVDWIKFLSENLEPDLAYWRKRAPLKAADVLTAYNMTLSVMNVPAVIQLVLIYKNKIYWPKRPDPNGGEPTLTWASAFNTAFHRLLGRMMSSGRIVLPNCIFVYNTDDNAPRFNKPARQLPVPLLSLIKSQGLEGGDDLDILVPQMHHIQNSLFLVPWHLKQDIAFFRGLGFCSAYWVPRYRDCPDPCARTYLAFMSERDRRAGNATSLDVALVEPWRHRVPGKTCLPFDLPTAPRVPIAAHSHHKYLLHLEGITASSRLGQLFMTNSLVLVQRQPWLEHFYRSLRPWVHYVPFWNATSPSGEPLGMDDVYGTLEELRRLDREQPARLQAVIAAANDFAVRYLTVHGRALYYQAALNEYKSLFADMEPFVESYVAELRAAGWKM